MQKTKFKVSIHKIGTHSQAFFKMFANHNADIKQITLLDIIGYVNCYAAMYPQIADGRQVVTWEGEDTLYISDKEGETPYLTIQECTYDELGEVGTPAEDDLTPLEQVEDIHNISQQGQQC